jgi:hypothetical protein
MMTESFSSLSISSYWPSLWGLEEGMWGKGFVCCLCNAWLIPSRLQMVKDGTTFIKLQKVGMGDGAIVDKKGTPKWCTHWVSGVKLSTYLFSWGWSFFELFTLAIVKFSSIVPMAI